MLNCVNKTSLSYTSRTHFVLIMLSLVIIIPTGNANGEFPATMALQGYAGVINTPTGHVQNTGTTALLYSNQKDHLLNSYPDVQNNYLFSVGMFSFAEVGGRLTDTAGNRRDLYLPENKGAIRDLSANVKLSSAPFTSWLPLAPAVALGVQDVAGGANYLNAKYIAASVDPLPWIRLSSGYGWATDRMKGAFGGVELQPYEWVTLLGEYDTRNTNAGLRLTSPPLPWFPASLTFSAKTTINRSSGIDIAFGMNIPLDTKKPVRSEGIEVQGSTFKVQRPDHIETTIQDSVLSLPASDIQNSKFKIHNSNSASLLPSLRTRLIAAGFANVRVGVSMDKTLVVEYENVRYNHNELDAIGIVAGIASSAEPDFDTLWLVVKRKGLRLIRVSTRLSDLRLWLEGSGTPPAPTLEVTTDTSELAETSFSAGDSNPDWLRPSLVLYPGLKTYVGTDVGLIDALLSIKPDLQVTLWKGGVLNARWDLPVAWSDNFNSGHQFVGDRGNPRLDRSMLFQGINLAPGLIANLGAGMILPDVNGTLNELTWSPGDGMHRFRLAQAYARNSATNSDKKVWFGSYRMYIAPYDLFIEGTAGRFWNEDSGGLLAIKRFFGDTAVELYVKSTETIENKRWNAAGIQFSFPLTPRRDMDRNPLQIRGADEWGYAQETVLAIGSQKSNDTISAGLAIIPLPSPDIYRSFLNRDRLNAEYIQSHKERIKDAWLTYRKELSDRWPKF